MNTKNPTTTKYSLDLLKKTDSLVKNQFKCGTDFDLFFKKFTNLLMIDGKKTKASKILFTMLLTLKKKLEQDPQKNEKKAIRSMTKWKTLTQNHLENNGMKSSAQNLTSERSKEVGLNFTLLRVISKALENVTPNVEVRKVRVAGSTYSVPAVLQKKKQETLAIKWIINSAKKKQKTSKNNFSMSLAEEFLDASRKLGLARQKRDELHRLAQINRAYIRYRWW
uniref:Ribosomal protein S7 n=1 Tax=Chlorella vulgaris TaxID=3077 RepID=A0A650AP20_CHLVU|nr:ribosomal protein S7 [Chlorella vulgaris]UNZ99616.1 ribosomal protein S7 [Chlorella vulgaris]USG56550.1 30S ribosomal protein S7 [Chlorella vulgaris]